MPPATAGLLPLAPRALPGLELSQDWSPVGEAEASVEILRRKLLKQIGY